jgi:hypothetical protein
MLEQSLETCSGTMQAHPRTNGRPAEYAASLGWGHALPGDEPEQFLVALAELREDQT